MLLNNLFTEKFVKTLSQKKVLMICFCLSLLFFMTLFPNYAIANTSTTQKIKIYHLRLDSEINAQAQRTVVLGIQKAKEADSDYIILDLNTYGGAVNNADSIRAAILRCPIPMVSYVNMQAASAGALISIACDSIYMKTGSSIGAATVVNPTGKVMPDKYQSFMRGMMRATAEANGRDPHVAESMVDTAHVLSMTPTEAMKVGYCEGICEDVHEVAQKIAGKEDYEIINMELTLLEKIVNFLLHPILQSIFLMMIIGGIYIEIKSPGIGLPLALAIIGALFYFSPLYIESLAQNWEILLFIVGLILLGVELFVIPGFGIAGILGILSIILSLTFAAVDNDLLWNEENVFDFTPVITSFVKVLVSTLLAIIGSIWLVGKLYPTKTFSHIALRESLDKDCVGVKTGLESLIGTEARVLTDLKPAGTVIIDGRKYEAVLNYGYATKGTKVKIIKAEQGRLYCSI